MKRMWKCLFVLFMSGTMIGCMNQSNENGSLSKEEIVLENIFSRKSVRQFQNRGVEAEKIETILKAGMAAPSGMDRRPWEFVVINEREVLDSLAAALPYAKMLANVRQAIVVSGDATKSSYWYVDCSAVTQNILLAAEALELGAVWTAAYPYEDRIGVIRKYTNMPDYIVPLCIIPIGYPQGEQKAKDKYDASKIHYNTY